METIRINTKDGIFDVTEVFINTEKNTVEGISTTKDLITLGVYGMFDRCIEVVTEIMQMSSHVSKVSTISGTKFKILNTYTPIYTMPND